MKYSPHSRKAQSGSGYTVTEVLIAVALSGLVLGSAFSGFSFGFTVLETERENLRATQLLQEKMETIRLYSWDQVNTPGFMPGTFQAAMNPTASNAPAFFFGTIVITNAPLTESYSTNLRQVGIELTWNSAGEHRRKMTTFVSRYGLQNYVY